MSKLKEATVTDLVATQSFNPEALIERAVAGSASIEVLERLFALSREVRAEQAKAAWHQAMAAFQRDVPPISKTKIAKVRTKSGAEYAYKFAPLEEVIGTIRPKLAEQGLSVTFDIESHSDHMIATAVVAHEMGHVERCTFVMPIDLDSHMNPAQQVASATTYARRYAYLAALGLCPEDDDDGSGAGDSRERGSSAAKAKATGGTKPQEGGDGPTSRGTTAANRPQPPRGASDQSEPKTATTAASPAWRGKLVNYEAKPANGGSSTKHIFTGDDGTKFGTFDKRVADGLLGLDGHFVEILGEATKYGVKIDEYRDANADEIPL